MIKIFVIVFTIVISQSLQAQSDLQLNFDSPASPFTQSIPLGNGRLGAMVFGGTNKERIVLNEISMWSGGVQDPNRHDAHKYFPEIQKLLQEESDRTGENYSVTNNIISLFGYINLLVNLLYIAGVYFIPEGTLNRLGKSFNFD